MVSPSARSACVVCGRETASELLSQGPITRVPLRRCADCKTVFQDGWREDFVEEVHEYYAECLGKPKRDVYDSITESRYHLISGTIRALAPGVRLLDVGCGHGHWVDFTMRHGWSVRGIDLAPFAVELCQSFGLPVTRTDFFSPELLPRTFDAITMFEFIEHVPSPGSFLRRAGELLVPGGVLLMSTPNFSCLDRRLLGGAWDVINEGHLSYFTPATLRRLVHETGMFSEVRITTRNVSLPALRHALGRGFVRRSRPTVAAAKDARMPAATPIYAQVDLRRQIEGSRVLRTAKASVNALLNVFDLGADMSIQCRRL